LISELPRASPTALIKKAYHEFALEEITEREMYFALTNHTHVWYMAARVKAYRTAAMVK
jgi:hypothetical protein